MDRETKEITVSDHKFVVKTYATARETNIIQSAYFEGAKVEVVGEQPKISEFNPNVQFNVQLAMVEQMVVKMDDSPDDVVNRCGELPNDTFQALAAEIDTIIAKKV